MAKPKVQPGRVVRLSERAYIALVKLQAARAEKGETRPALGQLVEELLFKKS